MATLGAEMAGGMKEVQPPEEEGAEVVAPWIAREIEWQEHELKEIHKRLHIHA